MSSILVVTEIQKGNIREASYELLALAHKVAGASGREVKSLVIGSGAGDAASEFASKGGGGTFLADEASLADYNVEGWSRAIRAAVDAPLFSRNCWPGSGA